MGKFNYEDIAKGYRSMSEINLNIANKFINIDNDALKLGEVYIIEKGLDEKK